MMFWLGLIVSVMTYVDWSVKETFYDEAAIDVVRVMMNSREREQFFL